ncbi:MAG: mitochondrial fission ELM1 family protein [Terasakiella sp.]|uniref:mitochondrial fission ELM1 family protein n=1 Tax=unclassified Terasakiella TaxID=2614952 RepID=UPI003AFFA70A
MKTIWVLLDDRAGNVNQCLGVAEALGEPFIRKDITYNVLAKLPNLLLGASLCGVSAQSRHSLKAPWPDLVIAAGRRTAPVARYIKKKSQGKTKLVQIMHPGAAGAVDFDLICVPAHDLHGPLQANEMTMFGAPHRVTAEKLVQAASDWADRFNGLSSPRIGLIVGGATKNRAFSTEMARDLGGAIHNMAQQKGASVLVTTSRRTGEAADPLLDEITVPSFKYKWGDKGDNPYFGILACSDLLIVTGDSVSMCSECCGTGKPVYVYAPQGMISDKHMRMVNAFIENQYALPFGDECLQEKTQTLNAAIDIAARIKQL